MLKTRSMKSCIADCVDCSQSCTELVPHCLGKGGRHAEPDHLVAVLDCADVCRTAAQVMMRGSDLHRATCAVCADACDRCAESCERVDPSDDEMSHCADICRQCAFACRRMAA